MWTVQEFLLGRDVIFLLGHHYISPGDIYRSLEKLDAWVIRSGRRYKSGIVLRQIRATTGISTSALSFAHQYGVELSHLQTVS